MENKSLYKAWLDNSSFDIFILIGISAFTATCALIKVGQYLIKTWDQVPRRSNLWEKVSNAAFYGFETLTVAGFTRVIQAII